MKKDLIGKKFYNLEVIDYSHKDEKQRCHYWICICNCNTLTLVRTVDINKKKIKSCGCLQKLAAKKNLEKSRRLGGKPKYDATEATFNILYSRYKANAKQRNIIFNLTKKEFRILTKLNCFYCKIQPYQITKNKLRSGTYLYNGIDRIDSNKDYDVKNCVTCCKKCNKMKGTLKRDEFIKHCKLIAKEN